MFETLVRFLQVSDVKLISGLTLVLLHLRLGIHKPCRLILSNLTLKMVCEYLVLTTFGNTTFDPNGTTTALPTDSDGLTDTEKILIGVLVPVRNDFMSFHVENFHPFK